LAAAAAAASYNFLAAILANKNSLVGAYPLNQI